MMYICELCEREVNATTKHHLIPRTVHRNKWFKKNYSRAEMNTTVPLCRDCHRQIHKLIPEKEMARHFNTMEKLRANEKVLTFVRWLTR